MLCPIGGLGGLMGAVLSIGKLAVGQASYYLEQAAGRVSRADSVGSGVEDYYVGGTEATGYWIGRGSESLGIGGRVEADDLTAALAGQDPVTRKQLSAAGNRRVPGFDVTFSAPKSVSVMFGVGDDRLRRAIRTAHDEAVADALGYLERNAARARRGRDGVHSLQGEGFVAAAFRHRTSRAGDPQLHTHVLLANLVRAEDGRWSALDGRAVYQHGKAAGFVYEASLRGRLTERLGVEWTTVRNGIADVEGVPAEVLHAFSRRRAEIVAELEERGVSGAQAARIATLSTRRRKDYGVLPEVLVAEWRARAARLGFDRDALRALLDRSRAPERVDWPPIFSRLSSSAGLTRRVSTFARRDVVQALCEQVPTGARVDAADLETQAESFLASGEVLEVIGSEVESLPSIRRRDGSLVRSRHHDGRFSTLELLTVEQGLVERALHGVVEEREINVPRAFARELKRHEQLNGEQREAVTRLVLGRDRVKVMIGPAGTGKTSTLAAAREGWEADGRQVVGAAVARRAARELTLGAGIDATSVTALLARLRLGAEPLPPRSVLVVDEAGMLPTRELAQLLRHVDAAGGTLVLVGDDRQLPELEAGGAFRGLANRLPAIRLAQNRRQVQAWERAALAQLRDGDPSEALEHYRDHGRLIALPDARQLRSRLVEDWMQAGGPHAGIMIALRRRDVAELNQVARHSMLHTGRLSGPELTCDGAAFAAGDTVLFRRNDPRLGINNGDRGQITAIRPAGMTVLVGDRHVAVDADYLADPTPHDTPAIVHGYAVTGHVAQGLTTDHAFVLTSDLLYREWAYTALSRGRQTNTLYLVNEPDRSLDEITPRRRPTVHAELLARLRRSRAKTMALDAGRDTPRPDRDRATIDTRAR